MEPSKKSCWEAPAWKETEQHRLRLGMSTRRVCSNADALHRRSEKAEGRMYDKCEFDQSLLPGVRGGGATLKLKRLGCSLRNLTCMFFVAALSLLGCTTVLMSRSSFLPGWRATRIPSHDIPPDFDAIEAVDINGRVRKMSEFSNMVKLIVNVASKCRLTARQYKELTELQSLYANQGFVVLAFPCRQFFRQEYANPADIKLFVSELGINFPVFAPVDVNGPGTHPVFLYCKWNAEAFYNPSGILSDIGWNFGKFLLDRSNRVYKYYGPTTAPHDAAEDIVALLQRRAKGWTRPPTETADAEEKQAE